MIVNRIANDFSRKGQSSRHDERLNSANCLPSSVTKKSHEYQWLGSGQRAHARNYDRRASSWRALPIYPFGGGMRI